MDSSSASKPTVRIVEVSPRDGLQNHPNRLPTTLKLDLIKRLAGTGLKTIELTSLVSPRAVPQLSDATDLLADPTVRELVQRHSFRAPVLVPNVQGLRTAVDAGVREVAVFVSATEGFSRANIRCSVQVGLDRARDVVNEALRSVRKIDVRAYVSCIFADPFDGLTNAKDVVRIVKALLTLGCYEVSLGDTLGTGTASDVRRLLKTLQAEGVSMQQIAGHFHDTYGQALANVWEAYQCGVRTFDSSVGGLGGCPFAPGAKGNVATEDLVYLFEQAGISTGVSLSRLVKVGSWISTQLNKANDSRTGTALIAARQRIIEESDKSLTWEPLPSSTIDLQIFRSGSNIKLLLDRPRNGNALTAAMIESLTKFFNQARADPTIRRIAISGSPTSKHFCTGMDLARDTSPIASSKSAADAQYTRLTTLLRLVDTAPQVTIAALNGPAYGGGVGLALACDIRIAAPIASLTLSEVTLGLAPATISPYVVRELGPGVAREAMLSGRTLTIQELQNLGVVSRTSERLMELLDAEFWRLSRAAPGASEMIKELVQLGWKYPGGTDQETRVKELFGCMMKAGGEAEIGLKLWREGKKVNWDQLSENEKAARAKL